jgi:hypothetical protein
MPSEYFFHIFLLAAAKARNEKMKVTLIVMLLLAGAPLLPASAGIPLTADAAYVTTPPHLEGYAVRFSAGAAPVLGEPLPLEVEVTPDWEGIRHARLAFVVQPGVSAIGETFAEVDFEEGPARAAFTASVDEPGEHMIRVEAEGVDDQGVPARGVGVAFVRIGEMGPGELMLDGFRVPQGPLPAVQVSVDMPADWDPFSYVSPPEAGEAKGLMPAAYPEPGTEVAFTEVGHSTFQVTACWNFRDYVDPSIWRNQRWAQVDVMDDDGIDDDVLWNGFTDSAGCFTTGSISRAEECCFSGNQDVYIKFILENSHVMIDQPDANGRYEYVTDPVTVGTQDLWPWGEFTTGTTHISARQFQYVNNAWDYGDNTAATTIGWQVEVETPQACFGSNPPNACYNPYEDNIYIPNEKDNRPEVTAHEYGHFVMDKFYGANDNIVGGPHSLCQDGISQNLAFSEGFSNYYGVQTNVKLSGVPGATGSLNYGSMNIETQDCGSAVTGDDNEWNVARTLWDLEDNGNDAETWDYSPFALLDIVDDCNNYGLRPYYDGSCSWVSHGYSSTDFRNAASKNRITY